jgi:diketogulonate reductase-like aldo/keto reductase
MDSKRFADTNVMLPDIGLGTWCYAGGIEPLRAGIALGAIFIDTAEIYGTEEVVGQAIKGMRPGIFLASKVAPKHFRRADVLRAADDSLRRLGTDHIDLYQLHWPNYTVAIDETMGAMEELVERGKIRFIGVSNFALDELKRAQKTMTRHRIVANQVNYSLVERTIESGLLPYCQREKIAIIAYSPLGHSLANLAAGDPGKVLQAVAERNGKTVPQVALNWCFSKPGVVAIPKSDSVEHTRDNCGASGWRLPAEDMELLNSSINFRSRSSTLNPLRHAAKYCLQKMGRRLG